MPRKPKKYHSRLQNLGSRVKKQKSETRNIKNQAENKAENTSDAADPLDLATRSMESGDPGIMYEDADGNFTMLGFLNDFERDTPLDFDFLNSNGDDSDAEDDGEDEGTSEDIKEAKDLDTFMSILLEAQRVAVDSEMEENVTTCLDEIPLLQIRRYANRSARFISAYDLGLSGAEAAWVNKRYHGHRTLPPIMVAKVRQAQINMSAPME